MQAGIGGGHELVDHLGRVDPLIGQGAEEALPQRFGAGGRTGRSAVETLQEGARVSMGAVQGGGFSFLHAPGSNITRRPSTWFLRSADRRAREGVIS